MLAHSRRGLCSQHCALASVVCVLDSLHLLASLGVPELCSLWPLALSVVVEVLCVTQPKQSSCICSDGAARVERGVSKKGWEV